MPTSRSSPESPRSASGFTLIEMLVVLTIVGLVAAVLATSMGGGDRRKAERGREQLVGRFAAAQSEARRSGRIVAVDPASVIAGARVLPGPFPARPGTIAFYPDGSASGGRVSLGDKARPIDVDWLTGKARDDG